MVNLTRIYTRTGDDGSTHLGDLTRTRKTDPRLAAFADVDEANSAIGVALACGVMDDDIRQVLTRIQHALFDVGADLCTPLNAAPSRPELRVEAPWVQELEADCDRFNADLSALRSFVLPGGSAASAYLHVARTVTRRAERATWRAIESYGVEPAGGGVNPLAATYLNRLSDLLFILCRVVNARSGDGDVLWRPGGGHGQATS